MTLQHSEAAHCGGVRRRVPQPRQVAGLICLLVLAGVSGQGAAHEPAASVPLELHYIVRLLRPTTHLVDIEIRADGVAEAALDFVMPAWSPGRYAIYDFAKNVQEFSAAGANDQPLPWTKTDKAIWRVDARPAGGTVRVRYRVFANDLSGSFSQFDSSHANLNGSSIFMYVEGHRQDPLTLRLEAPLDWKVFSGFSLASDERLFRVSGYDVLVDTPLEASPECLTEEFRQDDKTVRVVVHSYAEKDGDLKKLVGSLEKIVRAQLAMMPTPDFQHYTFIFHFAPQIEMGDGMEHLNSTQIVVRGELSGTALDEALEIASHEFFHVWNVERLCPSALIPVDYTREQYTRSLWFVEGVTTYYAYMHLLRAGVWTGEQFLKRLATEIQTLEYEPGHKLMSAESSSFHAWFYDRSPQMQQTNFANATINYYTKGAVLGLLLDLEIRARTQGRKSLDDVLVAMYRAFYQQPAGSGSAKGYQDADIQETVSAVVGSDLTGFFDRYVRGTEPLPYDAALANAGLHLRVEVSPGSAPTLGILPKRDDRGIRIAVVRPGGAADRGGLSRDDLLIAVDELSLATVELQDRLRMYPPGADVPFTVERHGRLQRIYVTLDPPIPDQYTIEELPGATPAQVRLRDAWLQSAK